MKRLTYLLLTKLRGPFIASVVACSPLAGCGGATDGGGDDSATLDSGSDSSIYSIDTSPNYPDTYRPDTAMPTDSTSGGADSGGSDSALSDALDGLAPDGTTGDVLATDGATGDALDGSPFDGGSADGAADDAADGGDRDATSGDASVSDANGSDGDASSRCVPGAACALATGGAGICNNLEVCAGCSAANATGDTECQGAYGNVYLCLPIGSTGVNECRIGDCRSSMGAQTPTCGNSSGGKICNNNVCSACERNDECTASSAYGAGHVCINGSCVLGTCVTSADCTTAGQICGPSHTCVGCSTDAQCAGDPRYATSAPLCDTTQSGGRCVAAQCSSSGNVCAGTHLCCDTTCLAGTSFSSTNPKSCCSTTDCTSGGTCTNHVCTACEAVSNGIYYVDPVGGAANDTGTGVNADGCRLRTIEKAISLIAAAPAGTYTIRLLGNTTLTNGVFLPANTTLIGWDGTAGTAAVRTIKLPGRSIGVTIQKDNAALESLTFDVTDVANRFTSGVVITGAAGVKLTQVAVYNSGGTGIQVGEMPLTGAVGGTVTLDGVVVTNAGIVATAPASGLSVLGNAFVTIKGSVAHPSRFDDNSKNGIEVRNYAAVAVTGVPGASPYGSATVTTNRNQQAGLLIAQNPSNSSVGKSIAQLNTVQGLVANQSFSDGISIEAGSKAKVRQCVALANARRGLAIRTATSNPLASTADRNTLAEIDLGTDVGAGAGGNVFQAPLGTNSLANRGAGLCVTLASNAPNVTLNAYGNTFVGMSNAAVNCATATPGTPIPKLNNCAATKAGANGTTVPVAFGHSSAVTALVLNCEGM